MWTINQHSQQHPVFEFDGPLTTGDLETQLENIGISKDKTSLTLNEIYANITVAKGAAFFTQHFSKTDATDLATRGKILDRLLQLNLLRPKQLDEEYGTTKFEEAVFNVKNRNWKLTAFDKVFGPKSTEFLFKNNILVQRGVFPRGFPNITPDHHLYPERPQVFLGKDVIMLQRNIHTGHKTVDALDIMYFASTETHIFSSVFKYETNLNFIHIHS
jgi:hypothetical protein